MALRQGPRRGDDAVVLGVGGLPPRRRLSAAAGAEAAARGAAFALVEPSERARALAALARDVALLRRLGLMDYSLLVGVVERKVDPGCSDGDLSGFERIEGRARQPFVAVNNGLVLAYYIGIIDFGMPDF